jgi:hypothetical protein
MLRASVGCCLGLLLAAELAGNVAAAAALAVSAHVLSLLAVSSSVSWSYLDVVSSGLAA